MEEIEYLEEYEDLVLPALNSVAAEATTTAPNTSTTANTKNNNNNNKVSQNQKVNNDDGDDSSSSLDQDIFNCLFDDNSDDDDEEALNEYQRSGDNQTALRKKSESYESFECLEDKEEQLEEKVIEKVEILRQEPINKSTPASKTLNKITASTPKTKTFITKTATNTSVPLNTRPQSSTSFGNKPKSVATVRPTVQNQQKQQVFQKKTTNTYQRSPATNTFNQRQKPTTTSSASTSSARSVQLPVLARKPLSTATSTTTTAAATSSNVQNKKPLPSTSSSGLKGIIKRPATIIRPEKIETKDPANDPLNLDDISVAGSENNYSLSDISGETYNSISEFEDDDSNGEYYSGNDDYYDDEEDDEDGISSSSQIIEISHESTKLDNKSKKIFKAPPGKSTTTTAAVVTPKGTKSEKALSTSANTTSIKRPLRCPAVLEADAETTSKKIKLDNTRKPTRLRNLPDESYEEKELSDDTANVCISPHNKQQTTFQAKIAKTTPDKDPELLEDPLKTTDDFTEKLNENIRIATTPRSSVKLLQKEVSSTTEVAKKPIVKETFNIKPNINLKKALPQEVLTNTPDKVKLSAKKSPSLVISFSDWLKTKKQNETSEPKEIKATENQSKLDKNSPSSSREATNIQEKTFEIIEKTPTTKPDNTMVSQHLKEKVSNTIAEDKEMLTNKTLNETQTTTEDELNSTFESTTDTSQLQYEVEKEETQEKTNNKNLNSSNTINRRRLKSGKFGKIRRSPGINAKPRIRNKIKKSEIDILIESMSKEMKESGITELLNTDTHIKRPRVASKRSLGASEEHSSNTTTTPTLGSAETITRTTTNAPVQTNNDIPKVLDFTENIDMQLTAATTTVSKSPTKRKQTQQNTTKSRKPTTALQATLTSNENIKVLPAKSRNTVNMHELQTTQQAAVENVLTTTTASQIKSRKSLPLTTKEAKMNVGQTKNVKSRKSLVTPKPANLEVLTTKEVFRTPKTPTTSKVLGVIPYADNIKKLYEANDTAKRSDSRMKNPQHSNLLKTYNLRKVSVRLDRSVVKKYLDTIKSIQTQNVTKSVKDSENVTNAGGSNVSAVPKTLSTLPAVIQNNLDTSLRIESVVDAATLINSPVAATLLATPETISQSVIIPDIIAQPPTQTRQTETYILSNNPPALSIPPQINIADGSDTIELKHEFMDENPTNNDVILPDTPTLLARAQSVTQAAQHALSNSITPTDIRLLSTDSTTSTFVPSFGVTPTALDNRGTSMYTFLHPAKYNRNHSNVLLDYCCPNLDGPMPAIDPTRIHAQVQIPVIELPASIVLTTKVVTRADLESGNSSIPAIIRKKAEKIRKNMATHHKNAVVTTPAPVVPTMTAPHMTVPTLPPTINALTKQLPATTTITAKIRPPVPPPSTTQMRIAQPTPLTQPPPTLQSNITPSSPSPSTAAAAAAAKTIPRNTIVSVMPKAAAGQQLSTIDKFSVRSSLRRFDVLLKQLVQPFDNLSFMERHSIIENLVATNKFTATDIEKTLELMEEYIKHSMLLQSNSLQTQTPPPSTAILSTTNYHTNPPAAITNTSTPLPNMQMPQLQPSPSILASASTIVPSPAMSTGASPNTYAKQFEKSIRKVQSRSKTITSSPAGVTGSSSILVKQRQVPIFDTDRNIIGYQMQTMSPMSSMPAYTKSTMSTHSGAIMSTSLDTTQSNKGPAYTVSKRTIRRPVQDSPKIFYTTPPLKPSTPKGLVNPHIFPSQHGKNTNNTIAKKTQVTTVRSAGPSATGISESITTTTMATVKRVTRSTATGSKIIIVSKSNQSSEETILPDVGSQPELQEQQTEIKNEKEDFIG